MKRTLLVVLTAAVAIGVRTSAAPRTVTHIYGPPGQLCTTTAPCDNTFPYPIVQGTAPVIDVEGQFVDLSTGLEVTPSTGVAVSTPPNGTSSGNHQVKVSVSADAEPGIRTVKLHYAVELNGPDTFKICIVRAGRVTAIPQPQPTDYFNDVNVTINGSKIDNAGVVVLPETIGAYSVGGAQLPQVVTLTQTTGTASIVSSSSAQTVVKVHFNGGPFAEAKGTLLLYDKQLDDNGRDLCQLHRIFCYTGLDGPTGSLNPNQSTFDAVGPNAVSSVTFPQGDSVTPGSQLTFQIKLVKPAKAGGEVVEWTIIPAASFVEATGSGTPFDPTHPNRVTIPAGDQFIQRTVQFKTPPAGCALTCTGQISTRTVKFNVDQLPYLRNFAFTMRTR